MSRCIKHREFIPVAEVPAEMPQGIMMKYYIHGYGKTQKLTVDSLKQVIKKLRKGDWNNIYLADDPDMEDSYMQLESGDSLYALQYIKSIGVAGEETWWSTYDPDYLDSNEETDIDCSDGQSIIYRENTTADKEAVMAAIEYFIRTGKLWNGIPWMKRWQEWVEE